MGLLDWLTDGIGSSMTTGGTGSAGPLVNATNNYGSPGSAPLSPAEMPPAPSPFGDRDKADLGGWPATIPPPAASPSDPAASGGGMPPGGTGATPTPMPMPRPAGAPGAPGPTAAPAPAAPPPSAAQPLPPPTSLAPPPSPMPPPDSGPAAPPVQPYHLGDQTALGRSLGINPNNPRSNNFNSAMAGLGEGLTAAGNSKGKSGGQAFAAGAGGAITGASKQDNAQYDQRLKALHLAVQAQAEGDKAGYDKNYAEYLKGKLANDAANGKTGGKAGAWNKPDSQKYTDAMNLTDRSRAVIDATNEVKQARADGDPNKIAAAQAKFQQVYEATKPQNFKGVQLSPQAIAAMSANPPGDLKNPHVVTSKSDFDMYVQPGQAYKNPSDGKIYIRNPAKNSKKEDDQEAPAGTTEGTTPVQPPGPAPGTAALEPEVGETP